MSDPIEPRPLRPLIDSYSYHSPLPDWLLLELDKDRSDNEQGWMLGIDEAGRGRRYHHCHRLCDGVLESRIALILILLLGVTLSISRTGSYGVRRGLLSDLLQAHAGIPGI